MPPAAVIRSLIVFDDKHPLFGTYKVAKNCTVTMDGAITIGRVNRQFGVIADRGRKIVTTRIDQGQSVVLTYERIK